MALRQALDELLSVLRERGVPIVDHLAPGLPAAEIGRLASLPITELGLPLHPDTAARADAVTPLALSAEMTEWFEVIGGFPPDSSARGWDLFLTPEFEPKSLPAALMARGDLVAWNGNPAWPDTYRVGIDRSLPLGTLSTLTFSAVVVAGSDTSPVSRWDMVSDLDTHLRPTWGSIEEMARDWTARWRDGRFWFDPEDGFGES